MQVKDVGVWKPSEPWVRDGGVWKPVDTGFVRDDGVWKPFYSAGPEPFLLSGSWEDGLEGWVTSGSPSLDNTSGASRARTGVWYARNGLYPTSNGTLTYTIPAESAAGLRIEASVWMRQSRGTVAGSPTGRITVSEEGGESNSHSATLTSTTYVERAASIVATGSGDVTVEIYLGGSPTRGIYADDWIIEGTAP